jgi:hypothetical protein
MKIDYVKSPKTGKWVKVGGEVYQKLLDSKTYGAATRRAKKVKRDAPGTKTHQKGKVTPAKSINLAKAKPRPLSKTLASTPKSRKAKRAKLATQIEHTRDGRGARTRGWAGAAPQKGSERHTLKEECGDVCFLKPDTEGFPICAALREGQGCKVDCRGVTSARVRAGQWKYPGVYKEASKLEGKYGC